MVISMLLASAGRTDLLTPPIHPGRRQLSTVQQNYSRQNRNKNTRDKLKVKTNLNKIKEHKMKTNKTFKK